MDARLSAFGGNEISIHFVDLFRLSYGKLYPEAVASLDDVLQELFTYMRFPKQHCPSIKSTNVIVVPVSIILK